MLTRQRIYQVLTAGTCLTETLAGGCVQGESGCCQPDSWCGLAGL
jgi:hypothetical protein